MDLRYVITGCAGSATEWASAAMTALGSPCGHENAYSVYNGDPPDGAEGESAWQVAQLLPADMPVLLLMRNPLLVVRSVLSLRWFLHELGVEHPRWQNDEYVAKCRPDIYEADDRFGRVLRYVATWDADVQAAGNVRSLKVEQVTGDVMAITYHWLTGRQISSNRCAVTLRALGERRNTHRRSGTTVEWDDISRHSDGAPVIAKAKKWGYL